MKKKIFAHTVNEQSGDVVKVKKKKKCTVIARAELPLTERNNSNDKSVTRL
jgi:hypothetical protein